MEKATDKQIAAIMKAKLHPEPWTLTKAEAWQLMRENFDKDEKPPVVRPEYTEKKAQNGREFHLSIEECRARALECSIEALKDKSIGEIRELTEIYFDWIWDGKR